VVTTSFRKREICLPGGEISVCLRQVSLVPVTLFGFLEARGLRRLAALHLLAFFLAVALAPHRHANSLEDLIGDGPSDSGVFMEGSRSQDPTATAQWGSARFHDDDPCLACFHHDFDSATEVIAFFALAPTFDSLSPAPAPEDLAIPDTAARPSRSRAPPPLA